MLSNNVGALKTSLKFNYYANTSVLKTTKYATNVKCIYHVDSCYPLVRSQLHFWGKSSFILSCSLQTQWKVASGLEMYQGSMQCSWWRTWSSLVYTLEWSCPFRHFTATPWQRGGHENAAEHRYGPTVCKGWSSLVPGADPPQTGVSLLRERN